MTLFFLDKYCGTAGKLGGKQRKQAYPKARGVLSLLETPLFLSSKLYVQSFFKLESPDTKDSIHDQINQLRFY